MPRSRQARLAPLRLALWYALASIVWIAVSDQLVGALGLPHPVEVGLNSIKGFLFVGVTSVFLYIGASRFLGRLEASERRYYRLFENATEGVMLLRFTRDPQGEVSDLVVEDANPAILERIGLSHDEVVGVSMSDSSGVDDELREYFQLVRDAVVDGRARRAEIHVESRDTYAIVAVFPFETGQWALAETDITQVRHAQQALREQDERIRQAYEDVLDAVTGGKLVLLPEGTLVEQLGTPLTDEVEVTSAEQLGRARDRIRRVVTSYYPDIDVDALLSAVGEALNNVLKHAGGGSFRVYVTGDVAQVAVTDHGPGIDFRTLPRATLVPGFSTTATLGMGFTIILQLCDRVLLATRPGSTIIVLEVDATRSGPAGA